MYTLAGPSSLQTRFPLQMAFLERTGLLWAQHPGSEQGALDVAHDQHPAGALKPEVPSRAMIQSILASVYLSAQGCQPWPDPVT